MEFNLLDFGTLNAKTKREVAANQAVGLLQGKTGLSGKK